MSFQPIRQLLDSSVSQHGLSAQLLVRRVLEVATLSLTALWGEERASFVIPVSFFEGTLKLESRSAAAMQQVRTDQVRVMNEINRRLGGRHVMRLEIRSRGF